MRSLTLRTLTAAVLILITYLSASPLAAQNDAGSASLPKPAEIPDDWSKALVESTLNRNPDPKKFGGWGYARSLYLFGQYLVYKRTHEPRYLDYIKQWIDVHIDENGTLDRKIDALDYILPANLLVILYNETGDAKYKKALDIFRHRFDDYPRTSDGGFWHATVPSRQHQLWLDGIFMGMPFLVRYGQTFDDSKYANDEAVKQILVYYSHLKDDKSGLLYHAYDESGAQKWADSKTHHSPYFWCRAIGWYGMATVDILDVLPKNHPDRGKLIKIVLRLVKDLARYQDPKTGLWYQIVDKTTDPNNWQETSSSSMFTYIIDVAVKRGYVSKKYEKVAQRGYRGVMSKVSVGEDGLVNITDICEGTNVADLAYYYGRKRPINDFHGLGAFLIMNEEFHGSRTSMQQTVGVEKHAAPGQ
jgi:unsaturated rhamnogalacturonyl hydrolase